MGEEKKRFVEILVSDHQVKLLLLIVDQLLNLRMLQYVLRVQQSDPPVPPKSFRLVDEVPGENFV